MESQNNKQKSEGENTEEKRQKIRSLREAFHETLKTVCPTKEQKQQAIEKHTEIRKLLTKELGSFKQFLLSGSYKRKTATNPIHDIDILIVVDKLDEKVRVDIQSILGKHFVSAKITLQDHSVSLTFQHIKPSFDIVPVQLSGSTWMVYNREKGKQQTEPKITIERCIKSNKRNNGQLLKFIRLLKVWNKNNTKELNKKLFKSFHLELIASRVNFASEKNDRERFRNLLKHILENINEPIAAPGNSEDVGNYLNDSTRSFTREESVQLLNNAYKLANEACEAEKQNNVSLAHEKWRELLGSTYQYK